MKYWNANNGKPYNSFELELIIAEMDFSEDNIESGFFYAIDNLPTFDKSDYAIGKINTLKKNKDWVIEYLERGNTEKAKQRLHKILPKIR